MSKKNWYFAVLIAAVVIVVLASMFNISSITVNVAKIKTLVMDLRIVIPAVICAFVFTKYNPYWMVMGLCALVVSASLQAYYGNIRLGNDIIFLRAVAFLVIVYIVDYARVVISRK